MSQEALYTKYRPSKLDDLVGQDHIVRLLKNSANENRMHHAYLITGKYGCGKSTTARIIAMMLNNSNSPSFDYDLNDKDIKLIINGNHPDVYEMDAASNTSIDDIREIRKSAWMNPIRGKKKVFIIDEVHAASKNAISALLKIIEEPPSSAVFILATTEVQKILPTIRSRCQRLDLKRISLDQITERLKYICEQEKVEIDNLDSLKTIAKSSEGSLRNAISLLEGIISSCESKIDQQKIATILGLVEREFLLKLFDYLWDCRIRDTLILIKGKINTGSSPEDILGSMLEYIHDMMISKGMNYHKHLYIPESLELDWLSQREKISNKGFLFFVKKINEYFSKIENFPRTDICLDACIFDLVEGLGKIK